MSRDTTKEPLAISAEISRYSLYSSGTHCCSLSSWVRSGLPPRFVLLMASSTLSLRYLGLARHYNDG
jgi:hypothetical protein